MVNGAGHLIACSPSSSDLGEEIEMVQYIDSTGQELCSVNAKAATSKKYKYLVIISSLTFQEDVTYYALDGQEYSVIQGNEEIVVSTEPRLLHEEQHLQQSEGLVVHPIAIEVSSPKVREGRGNPKRKKYN